MSFLEYQGWKSEMVTGVNFYARKASWNADADQPLRFRKASPMNAIGKTADRTPATAAQPPVNAEGNFA